MNYKKLLKITSIVVSILLLFVLFLLIFKIIKGNGGIKVSSILCADAMILSGVLFSSLYINRKSYVIYRRLIQNMKIDESLKEMIKMSLGKEVVVTTLVNEIRGILVETEGDWIRVKDFDMRPMEHILKSSMILSIKIK